jgi:hypothetical protein
MNRDSIGVWWMISLASAGYGGSQTARLLQLHMVFQPMWGWGDLGFFQLFQSKFFTRRSLKSWWVYLALHEGNRSHC